MDALIRQARLAPGRTRLSETRADRVGAAAQSPQARPDAMREELEKQVRSELAAQMQKLYDSERTRARDEGRAAAVAEAKAAAAEELAEARRLIEAHADSAIAAMETAHQTALSRLEANVGEVAFAAVCRLLGRGAPSREHVLGLVEQTCAALRADVIATARLHPRDIGTLQQLLQDQELRVHSIGLKLIPDESLELGGCVIEAKSGQYDGGLEGQLTRLYAVLVGNSPAPVPGASPSEAARMQAATE